MRGDSLSIIGIAGVTLLVGCQDPASAECGFDAECRQEGPEPNDQTAGDKGDAPDTGTTGSAGTDTGDNEGEGIPCAVRDALAVNCGMCHGQSPAFGATMSLVDFDDLQVPAPSDPTRPTFELVADRLVDPVKPMPPGGNISDADKDTLLTWVGRGAPADPNAACGDAPEPEGEPVGPDELPCEVTHEFTAHAAGSDTDPFHIPAQGADDLYQCFSFHSPFAPGAQATGWAPIIDDERVVHHWILYRTTDAEEDGGVYPCDVSLQLTAEFVAGWAPGGGNLVMPDHVGLELGGPEHRYILQIHYNNVAQHSDALDRSGVAFCAADEPRPQTAGILTVGTVGINIPPKAEAYEETGTCGGFDTFGWPQLNVLGGSPHMHELGRGFRTELARSGGGVEMVTDVPIFNFEDQRMYLNEPEIVINPGDKLTTTCVFDNPYDQAVTFGEGTGDEMCFNFLMVYPVDQLPNRNCGIIF